MLPDKNYINMFKLVKITHKTLMLSFFLGHSVFLTLMPLSETLHLLYRYCATVYLVAKILNIAQESGTKTNP